MNEVAIDKVKKHTDVISYGARFNEGFYSHEDIFKMLKQISSIIKGSDFEKWFANVPKGRNLIETSHNFLNAMKQFNDKNNDLYMFVERDVRDFKLCIETYPMEEGANYLAPLDFYPIFSERYPAAAQLFILCINRFHKEFDVSFDGGYYTQSDHLEEQLYERIENPEQYEDSPETTKMLSQIRKHWENHYHGVYTDVIQAHSYFPLTTKELVQKIDNRTGCNFPKLDKVNQWFDMAKDLFLNYQGYRLMDYHDALVEEIEQVNGATWDEICENGCPVTIFDTMGFIWFGNEDTKAEIDNYIEMYARETGILSVYNKFYFQAGSKIPKGLLDTKQHLFIKKVVDLLVLTQQIRDSFILKKHNYLS